MALLHVDFFSNVLGMCMNMDVILPQKTEGQIGMEGVGSDEYTYPTLYLLHGMSDDHTIWQRRTSIERYANQAGIAVVMPTTHLGFYTDMKHGLKYFTFIAKELPQICRDFFPRMSPKREETFVAGLSMGGYGAVKCGLNCPETFSKAASLSGGLGKMRGIASIPIEERVNCNTLVYNIFGTEEEFEGSENDLFACAKRLKDSGKPLCDIFQWCGTEDFLYEQNVDFRNYMQSIDYPVTYTESPGVHAWEYWDEQIQNVLRWMLPERFAH